MFERFTQRAQRVMTNAADEARTCGSPQVDSGHILLALVMDLDGIAGTALVQTGITENALRSKMPTTSGLVATSSPAAFSPDAKKILELSLREALRLGHNYVGVEHLLLAIVRHGQGAAVSLILALRLDEISAEVLATRERIAKRDAETAARASIDTLHSEIADASGQHFKRDQQTG